jgi:hypothetical protein
MTMRLAGSRCFTFLALFTSCAAMQPLERQSDFGDYFTLRLPDRTEQARLEGRRLYGADIELEHLRDGYRGTVRSGLIDLRTDGEKIYGSVGTGHTELHVEEVPGSLFLTGMYAGRLGELEVRADRVKGTIGQCTYDMSRHPEAPWYQGTRLCQGRFGGAELAFPLSLARRSVHERAVLLAVFLGR